MRLLIVEDDEKTARALASGLERAGFSTAMAHTGEEGFFLLNAETFDLVVLDWMLPGRSGIEILLQRQHLDRILKNSSGIFGGTSSPHSLMVAPVILGLRADQSAPLATLGFASD